MYYMDVFFFTFRVRKNFSNYDSKSRGNKERIDKVDYRKIYKNA